jgi:prepilin-type N-terminal cleavage/methylation domain-containing protein
MKKLILVNILKNKKAFTLLELLVVVAIIGILSAVGVYGYNEYTYAAKVKIFEYQKSSLIRLVNAELAKCVLNQKDSSEWVRVMDGHYYIVTGKI